MSHEVREMAEGAAALQQLQSVFDSKQSELLQEAIACALLEAECLKGQLSNECLFGCLVKLMQEAEPLVKERCTIAVVSGEGLTMNIVYELTPSWELEQLQVWNDLLPWAFHAQLLSESKGRSAQNKEKKKKEIKATANEEMAVDDSGLGSIQKQVEKAVARAVKKLKNVHKSISTIASSSKITTDIFDLIVSESQSY